MSGVPPRPRPRPSSMPPRPRPLADPNERVDNPRPSSSLHSSPPGGPPRPPIPPRPRPIMPGSSGMPPRPRPPMSPRPRPIIPGSSDMPPRPRPPILPRPQPSRSFSLPLSSWGIPRPRPPVLMSKPRPLPLPPPRLLSLSLSLLRLPHSSTSLSLVSWWLGFRPSPPSLPPSGNAYMEMWYISAHTKHQTHTERGGNVPAHRRAGVLALRVSAAEDLALATQHQSEHNVNR
jgi:hypothetical protein